MLDNDPRKVKLIHSLLFTLAGSAIIYYGDEIGMGDNIWLPDRNGVRTPMQWSPGRNAGFSAAPVEALYTPVIDDPVFGPAQVSVDARRLDGNSIWNAIRNMLQVRKTHGVFGSGELEWLGDVGGPVAASFDVRAAATSSRFTISSMICRHLRSRCTSRVWTC